MSLGTNFDNNESGVQACLQQRCSVWKSIAAAISKRKVCRALSAHNKQQSANSSFFIKARAAGCLRQREWKYESCLECLQEAHSATFCVTQHTAGQSEFARKQDLFATRVGNYVGSHLDTICLPSGFSPIYGLIIPTLPPHTSHYASAAVRLSCLDDAASSLSVPNFWRADWQKFTASPECKCLLGM
jgi:hypothetical protein